jgi:hypothetical protein
VGWLAHFFTSLFQTTLAQIPPREILLLEELLHTGCRHFLKVRCENDI